MNPKTRRIVLMVVAVLLIGGLIAWWQSGFSLDFSRFFASEPGVLDSPQPSPTVGVGARVGCSPVTQTVAVNSPATLNAAGGTSGAYEWFAPEGTPATATGITFSVTYDTTGAKKVTVQSPRNDASGNVDNDVCTVVVTP